MSDGLDRLAEACGVSLGYLSEGGVYRRVSDRAKKGVLAAMGVPVATSGDITSLTPITSTASGQVENRGRCFVPEWLRQGRAWGITCQLYGLRSARNWGIGDFEDLARLAEYAATLGADFLGVSPLHALFLSDPRRCSPYSPSSRRFLNPLYIAVDKVGGRHLPDAAIAAAREAPLVDYVAVSRLKRAALADSFAEFEREHLARGTESAKSFEAYCSEQGEGLDLFARFEALSEELVSKRHGSGWQSWPTGYQSRSGPDAVRFVHDNPQRVLFHKWLQWLADGQLADAQRRARAAGMRIGLFLDLAVGVSPDGADAWTAPDTVISGAHIGSPPDLFNPLGQDWGLCPLSPVVLQQSDGAAVAAIVRASMRHAGAIRIDHVMGLVRLYWIPADLPPDEGAYVNYPGDILMRQLASASVEHAALVIGEDLGTVPAGLRDVMRDREIHGYRVLYFERTKDGGFRAPEGYPAATLACIGTHDLPTLRGWWVGRDIVERERLGMYDLKTARLQHEVRMQDRRRLLGSLTKAGLAPAAGHDLAQSADLPETVLIGLHAFLASVGSRLVAVQLEDMVGMEEQANLPGTVDEHPNWRRKLPVKLEDLPNFPGVRLVAGALAGGRPRPS